MIVDLVPVPSQLQPHHLEGRAVVIFDVLRATTSMVTAIASGAREIRVFGSLDAAASAARGFAGPKLLCGEQKCLPPPGFDLGNSPVDFALPQVAGKTLFMSTTNGTRAIVAAAGAKQRLVAGLVNAAATARCLAQSKLDVTLLCAGTEGEQAPEDVIGAGAVFAQLERLVRVERNDTTAFAADLFQQSQPDLGAALRNTAGGQNIIRAGLDRDIDFAAQVDRFDLVVNVSSDPPVARRMIEPCQPHPTSPPAATSS